MPAKKNLFNLKGIKSPMPERVAPMLCTLTKEPPGSPDYLYEIKWDGYRIISYVKKGKVRMDSRSSLDYTKKYPPVANALKNVGHDMVIDGEVVVFNKEGVPDFDSLQLYNGHETPITYCVFDILWLDGNDLMNLPLTERKDILQSLVKGNDILRFSDSFDDGTALYQQMLEKNLEGIVAKKKDSPYLPGQRGKFWLKTPTRKRQEFVIGGWSDSSNGRAFKSLLFGAYDDKKLKWIGRSGGGYKEKEMPGILKQLKALETDKSPFDNAVLDTKGAKTHWIKPELVGNFEFATWTKSGRIRKPATFLGFRKDKKPAQVVREVPVEINTKRSETNTNHNSNWPEVLKQSKEDVTMFELDDCRIELFDVDREIWKGITKADLIGYYHKISDYILPHIKDRPQSLHIKLHGANAPGLYIKDMEGHQPECASIFTDQRRHKAEGKRDRIDYLVCNNEATLLWMINIGCIDINPWNSRITDPLHPDYIVIDLDPNEKHRSVNGLKRLVSAAMAAKSYFDENELKAFAKTSGKTGMHFLVPCSGFNYSEARNFAEHICEGIHKIVPDISTINNSISKRGERIYIDPSQNDYADTIAAPYSARPYILPTVSTPLEWKEINAKLDPDVFTIKTISGRLQKKGDLFAAISDKKIISKNNKILKTLF